MAKMETPSRGACEGPTGISGGGSCAELIETMTKRSTRTVNENPKVVFKVIFIAELF